MPLTADLCTIKTDRFCIIPTITAAVTAAAISIIQCHTVVTHKIICSFYNLIITKLISSIFIFKTPASRTADLTAVHPEPNAFGIVTIMAQFAHTLHQFIVFTPPCIIIQRAGRQNTFYRSCRPFSRRNILNLFQIPVGRITAGITCLLPQLIALPEQTAFTIDSSKSSVIYINTGQNCTQSILA